MPPMFGNQNFIKNLYTVPIVGKFELAKLDFGLE